MSAGTPSLLSTAGRGGGRWVEAEKAFLVVEMACAQVKRSECKESVSSAGAQEPGLRAGQLGWAVWSPLVPI